MDKTFINETLECGARLVAEKLPNFHSVTAGIWVGAGSVTETEEENGISHLIEHMLFKGTEKRTSKQIAVDVDNIGGQINAFTSKECTCYYIKMIDEKLEQGMEILTDLFCNATLPDAELEKERNVVLEEIAMSNDTPEDVAMELISSTYFSGCSLEKTILGPAENIRRFMRRDMVSYMNRYYTASNIIVAVAGNFDEQELKDCLNRLFGKLNRNTLNVPSFADCTSFAPKGDRFETIDKDIEQVHLCMGMPGIDAHDKRKYALDIANNVIGGSMSSRLFQKIREEMGMAYSVFTYPALYRNAGMYGVYAGTMASNAEQVAEMILKELKRVKNDGITKEEFMQSREQSKGNMILSLESTSSKMSSIGKAMILTGNVYSDEEALRFMDEVRYEDLRDVLDTCLDFNKLTVTCVGTIPDKQKLHQIVR
ncbi:MAG: pitrilysin family protein [Christensenella sp.]